MYEIMNMESVALVCLPSLSRYDRDPADLLISVVMEFVGRSYLPCLGYAPADLYSPQPGFSQ